MALHRPTAIAALLAALAVAAVAVPLALGEKGATVADHRSLVSYHRSGGLAGGAVRLVISPGGEARLRTRSGTRRASLARPLRARLVRALRRSGFAQLEPRYEPSAPVPDAFTYTLTYRHRTVRAVDTAVPTRLRPAISVLDRIVTKLERRKPRSRL